MGPALLLTSLATTIFAGPVHHEARVPLQTGNSTVGTPLNMVVAEAGSQTQTASPPELKKAIDEHLSLIISVSVIVAVVFFAGLDRLTHKWRVSRRQRAHEEAEASTDENAGSGGEATTLTQQATISEQTTQSTKGSKRDTGQEAAENCKPAAARQTNTDPDAIIPAGY